MLHISVKNQNGLEKIISATDLVKNNKNLCAANLIPPFELVRRFFLSGSVSYSHWEDFYWDAVDFSMNDYDALCSNLRVDGFKDYSGSTIFDDLTWEAVQTATMFNIRFDDAMSYVRRMNAYEGILSAIAKIDGSLYIEMGDNLQEIELMIKVKINEEIERFSQFPKL